MSENHLCCQAAQGNAATADRFGPTKDVDTLQRQAPNFPRIFPLARRQK
jgi:hypothetical protein